MPMTFRKASSVYGVTLPRRHFTGWAVLYFLIFVCAPVLGGALLLDVMFYLVFTRFFDSCYGVLCLLG